MTQLLQMSNRPLVRGVLLHRVIHRQRGLSTPVFTAVSFRLRLGDFYLSLVSLHAGPTDRIEPHDFNCLVANSPGGFVSAQVAA